MPGDDGTRATELRGKLALESEAAMPVAEAAAHHAKAIKAPFPDAPDWLAAADESAWKVDNGIQTGICAVDCKSSRKFCFRARFNDVPMAYDQPIEVPF